MAMKIVRTDSGGFQEILGRKQAELVQVLRNRDGIAIEKSAEQMDEIQYASERDLAIQNVDRETILLREECEWAISPKRLAAVPWASRCIQCQEIADRDWQQRTESVSEPLVNAA
jgi:DnaK suppressor protein